MSEIHYHAGGPVIDAFINSDAFVCGIRGPIGSGKSVGSVMKLIRNMQKQTPSPDGVIYRRAVIVRNTFPELRTTTIPTWQQWVPKTIGKWKEVGPLSQTIETHDDKGKLVAVWEIWFLALDRPDDVAKLLSLEPSDIWINEARELPRPIIDGVTGRVGRYPSVEMGGCVDPQVIMDTNSPDTDHWWARMADFPDSETTAKNAELEDMLRRMGALRPDQPAFEFFAQPSGRSKEAENLKNLPLGYYQKAMINKSAEWVKVYVDGEYGFVMDGKPVYPEYHDGIHCQNFELNRSVSLYIGIDFGLTPAAVFGQRMPSGQWRWHSELVSDRMGARQFGEAMKIHIAENYAGCRFAGIYGDPAGTAGSQADIDVTCFQILRAVGIEAQPAPSNEFTKRRESVAMYLNRLIDGYPGLVIHPQCQKLRKAMSGGYHYRRVQISGDERYQDKPDKGPLSHVAEAAQYLMIGAGEGQTLITVDLSTRPQRQQFATSDYRLGEF